MLKYSQWQKEAGNGPILKMNVTLLSEVDFVFKLYCWSHVVEPCKLIGIDKIL